MPRATSSSLYSRKKLGRILRNGDFFFPLYPTVRALKMPSQTGIYWQHCQGCNSYPCCVSVPASQMCTWEFFRGTTMCIPYPKPAMVLFSLSSTDSKWGEQSQAISPLCYREDIFSHISGLNLASIAWSLDWVIGQLSCILLLPLLLGKLALQLGVFRFPDCSQTCNMTINK